MAANNLNEVFNFVHKFLSLRKNGDNASLSLQCQDGQVTINLQLQLPPCPPPHYRPHPPPCPHPRNHPSPSRVRRTIRRANARAEKADNDALLPPPNPSVNATEQVDDGTAVQASVNTAHDFEAEQAFSAPTKLSPKIPTEAEQADPTGGHDQSLREAESQEQDQELQQLHAPPLGRKQSIDGHTTEVHSEPQHNITVEEFSEMKEIMEEFKINFSNGLVESVREGIRDAFKPP